MLDRILALAAAGVLIAPTRDCNMGVSGEVFAEAGVLIAPTRDCNLTRSSLSTDGSSSSLPLRGIATLRGGGLI